MAPQNCITHSHAPAAFRNNAARRFSLGALLGLWRSRRDLAALTPEQLDDIGVSPSAAVKEANRSAWDVPAHWRD